MPYHTNPYPKAALEAIRGEFRGAVFEELWSGDPKVPWLDIGNDLSIVFRYPEKTKQGWHFKLGKADAAGYETHLGELLIPDVFEADWGEGE